MMRLEPFVVDAVVVSEESGHYWLPNSSDQVAMADDRHEPHNSGGPKRICIWRGSGAGLARVPAGHTTGRSGPVILWPVILSLAVGPPYLRVVHPGSPVSVRPLLTWQYGRAWRPIIARKRKGDRVLR
jgi:hypothetical protein